MRMEDPTSGIDAVREQTLAIQEALTGLGEVVGDNHAKILLQKAQECIAEAVTHVSAASQAVRAVDVSPSVSSIADALPIVASALAGRLGDDTTIPARINAVYNTLKPLADTEGPAITPGPPEEQLKTVMGLLHELAITKAPTDPKLSAVLHGTVAELADVSATLDRGEAATPAMWDLPLWTLGSIFLAADFNRFAPFLCHKFHMARGELSHTLHPVTHGRTTFILHNGRVFRQPMVAPDGRTLQLKWYRLPQICKLEIKGGCIFAHSTAGPLFAWGTNTSGILGVNRPEYTVRVPLPVVLPPGRVDRILCGGQNNLEPRSFFHVVGEGWFAAGVNTCGALGVGEMPGLSDPAVVVVPRRVDTGGRTIVHWASDFQYHVTFAITDDPTCPVMACGDNCMGQLGIGTEDQACATLRPVAIPAGTVVTDVMTARRVAAIFTKEEGGTGCFVCGANKARSIYPDAADALYTPMRLPFAISSIILSLCPLIYATPLGLLTSFEAIRRYVTLDFATIDEVIIGGQPFCRLDLRRYDAMTFNGGVLLKQGDAWVVAEKLPPGRAAIAIRGNSGNVDEVQLVVPRV
ncbi:Regulator of chromosome condensation (RCC1) repeat [Carpediemonas membranifera]|uniref:Regulator of chromosome condensation (RCC1) repeat n=1 Tax=Carpediemonas membranifera TaxID=201153 RepID=A0A8J6E363_9EUKA|nr:Regulator of chromosome condensation (RCC1) repeat [Carpediemonas membranifera]|eukprot:KAG9395201.1 Regulator of chromosome condensation (RCC1) repeat [Carpediemonas membranifera]